MFCLARIVKLFSKTPHTFTPNALELLTKRESIQLSRHCYSNHNQLRSCGAKHNACSDLCTWPQAISSVSISRLSLIVLASTCEIRSYSESIYPEIILSHHAAESDFILHHKSCLSKNHLGLFLLNISILFSVKRGKCLLCNPSKHFQADFMEHVNFNCNCFDWFHTLTLCSTDWLYFYSCWVSWLAYNQHRERYY